MLCDQHRKAGLLVLTSRRQCLAEFTAPSQFRHEQLAFTDPTTVATLQMHCYVTQEHDLTIVCC